MFTFLWFKLSIVATFIYYKTHLNSNYTGKIYKVVDSGSPITRHPITRNRQYPDIFLYSIVFDNRIRILNMYRVSGYNEIDGSITELVRLSGLTVQFKVFYN
jgi:hypothetical protein